jgi:hypothetical protein
MAEGCRVVLHLGAHKTASTHLQQALRRARPALARAGTAVLVPDDLRKDGLRLQDWLALSNPDLPHQAALRAAFGQPARRLVISEENVPGQVPGGELARAPVLYPRAAERLSRLRTLVPPGPVTLALAVREGAGFVASCYSQALMAGRVAPFGAMFGGLDPALLGWDDLAGRLLTAWPEARLVVWDHADWPEVVPQVALAVLGPDAPRLTLPPGLSHPGLSAAAVARLLAEAPPDGDTARALARDLRARLGKDGGHAPFDPWDPATRARAATAHAAELARLSARPRVTLLRPGQRPG